MKTTIEFLDAVRAAHALTSDYQLANFLGISRERVSRYRHRGDFLGEETALKVAQALSLPEPYVLTCVAAERTKNANVRRAWIKAAAATFATMIVALALPGFDIVSLEAAGLREVCILCQIAAWAFLALMLTLIALGTSVARGHPTPH